MQGKAIFQLFIPALLLQLNNWSRDFSFEANAPHLSSLLLQYDKKYNEQLGNIESTFFNLLNPSIDELPVAYYRNQAQNNQSLSNLICSDPVHLEVGMNDVILTNKVTDLTDSEAKELIAILNTHFEEDGLEFIFGSNQCWYVASNKDEAINSHTLDSMLLKNVIGKLVKSEQRNWQVVQNEIQMLLHSSEINQQREMAGLETINSLWLWGGGKALTRNSKDDVSEDGIEAIYIPKTAPSNLRASYFAKAANCDWNYIPDDINQMVDDVNHKKTTQVILLEQLFISALEDNIEEFQMQLTQLDKYIIKPLSEAWKEKKIDIEINCCDGAVLKPKHPSFYKFWLKPKTLLEIANETRS